MFPASAGMNRLLPSVDGRFHLLMFPASAGMNRCQKVHPRSGPGLMMFPASAGMNRIYVRPSLTPCWTHVPRERGDEPIYGYVTYWHDL